MSREKQKTQKRESCAQKEEQKLDSGVIGERNRIALAYIELAKDKTFQKLPEGRKMELIKEALSIGDGVASWVLAEYGTNDPRKIAAKLGVRVFGLERGRSKGAEYRKEKKEIVLYRDYHERLLREVKSQQLSEHLLKFLVAHELFHHFELSRIGEVYKKYKFETWRLGPFSINKHIKGISDVAAHAFTQSLIDLDISPQVFDYLTYILYTNS